MWWTQALEQNMFGLWRHRTPPPPMLGHCQERCHPSAAPTKRHRRPQTSLPQDLLLFLPSAWLLGYSCLQSTCPVWGQLCQPRSGTARQVVAETDVLAGAGACETKLIRVQVSDHCQQHEETFRFCSPRPMGHGYQGKWATSLAHL